MDNRIPLNFGEQKGIFSFSLKGVTIVTMIEVLTVWSRGENGSQSIEEVHLSLHSASSRTAGNLPDVLSWDKEQQKFTVPNEQSTEELGIAESPEKHRVRHVDACVGVFGVVPLGHFDSSLLLITEATPVRCTSSPGQPTLRLPGGHEVYEIVKMQHIPLPSKVYVPEPTDAPESPSPSVEPPHTLSPPLVYTDYGDVLYASPHYGDQASAGRVLPAPIGSKALSEYRRLLDTFVRCKSHADGVHFYFSPTCPELCRDPEIVRALLHHGPTSLPKTSSRSSTPSVAAHHIESTFRWNANVLDAFSSRSHHNTPIVPPSTVHAASHPSSTKNPPKASYPTSNVQWLRRFIPSVFRGYVGGDEIQMPRKCSSNEPLAGDHCKNRLVTVLVTRLACSRAGTRYNRRGLDAVTGMVANFSETTQLVFQPDSDDKGCAHDQTITSFRVLRGSIPRCWQQPANLTFKPTITVSPKAAGQRELRCHLLRVRELFGEHHHVHCLDATSSSALERPLSEAYASAFDSPVRPPPSPAGPSGGVEEPLIPPLKAVYTKFDISAKMKKEKTYSRVQEQLIALAERAVADEDQAQLAPTVFRFHEDGGSWISTQQGIFRVNCLDCLDRANLVQSMLCLHVSKKQVAAITHRGDFDAEVHHDGAVLLAQQVDKSLRGLWAGNGRALSALYAGSPPHFLEFLLTGRRGSIFQWASASGSIALQRYLQQNFYDGPKQDTVSLVTRAYHAKPVSANPFDRRMTTYKALLFLAILFAVGAMLVNAGLMILFERYRFRTDFVAILLVWCSLVSFLGWKVFTEPSLVASMPVLEIR